MVAPPSALVEISGLVRGSSTVVRRPQPALDTESELPGAQESAVLPMPLPRPVHLAVAKGALALDRATAIEEGPGPRLAAIDRFALAGNRAVAKCLHLHCP